MINHGKTISLIGREYRLKDITQGWECCILFEGEKSIK